MKASENPDLDRLRWLRRLVAATLALGIGGTTSANVLHAQDTIVGRIIAAWAPITLLLTIEVITRVPVPARLRSRAVIWGGTGVIALIAAWVSYWHMAAVAARYGEDPIAAHLLPFLVDGTVAVMSVILVDLGTRIRGLEPALAGSPGVVPAVLPGPAPGVPPLPPPPDIPPGADALTAMRALALVRDEPAEPQLRPAAATRADELLPTARTLTRDLPTLPGRPTLQRLLLDEGHDIGWRCAKQILEKLQAERERTAA